MADQDRVNAAHTLGVLSARREILERLAADIRKRASTWRGEDGRRSLLVAALLWPITEAWLARLEAWAVQVDTELAGVRAQEVAARQAFEALNAHAQAAPAAKPCTCGEHRTSRGRSRK